MFQVVATGWWCTNCEFFEMDEDQAMWSDSCTDCSCDGSAHQPVEVVTKSL